MINDRREVSEIIESELGNGSIGKWMGIFKSMTYNSNSLSRFIGTKMNGTNVMGIKISLDH